MSYARVDYEKITDGYKRGALLTRADRLQKSGPVFSVLDAALDALQNGDRALAARTRDFLRALDVRARALDGRGADAARVEDAVRNCNRKSPVFYQDLDVQNWDSDLTMRAPRVFTADADADARGRADRALDAVLKAEGF